MTGTLGLISIAVAAVSYTVYFRNTAMGLTKPHAMTWLIWSMLNLFVFYEQFLAGAGPGAWVTGVAALANFSIFIFALAKAERNITRFDWICLLFVIALLIFWAQISDPALAVVVAIAIFLAGFFPTMRKASKNAHEETALTFGLNGLKFLIALFALSTISITTALYPLSLFIVNSAFALYLLIARRRQGPRKKSIVMKRKRA